MTVFSVIQLQLDIDCTSIRRAFDGSLTAHQRSLRSQWRNTGRRPASRGHADLFTCLGRSAAASGRDVGRRMVVARSNCGWIEFLNRKSNRSCNHCLRSQSTGAHYQRKDFFNISPQKSLMIQNIHATGHRQHGPIAPYGQGRNRTAQLHVKAETHNNVW